MQSPNFFGAIDAPPAAGGRARSRQRKTLLIGVTAEALALAALATPASWGADIAAGEAQSFGNAVAYGGPHVGFIATTDEHLRRIPGRLVGRTVDSDGRTAYVLTLQAREQHIRREKATSNICTNQAHCALIATIYLAALGKTGLRDVAAHNLVQAAALRDAVDRARRLRARALPRRRSTSSSCACRAAPRPTLAALRKRGIVGGLDLGRFYPELADCILMTATELTTAADIERLVAALAKLPLMPSPAFDTPLIFDGGQDGRANRYVPAGAARSASCCRPALLRDDLPLPDNTELDVVRHFTRLSQKTFGIDTAFYPLGSCTMKYNPRINDALANLPALRDLHPFAPDELAQGALAIMWELERSLASLFGMAAFSLNPAAGAHAELTALLIAKAYYKKKGDARPHDGDRSRHRARDQPGVGRDGRLQRRLARSRTSAAASRVDAIRAAAGPDTAVCMMTNPNTLGLFEDHIHEIAAVVHAAGGLMYYDGANANALMGNSRPGDMGFDLMHLNLHKTFSIPHGGGGAGAGPVGVAAHLVPFLPTPVVRAAGYDEAQRPLAVRRLDVRARVRPAGCDRHDALVLVELRAHGASARVLLRQRRRRAGARLATRGAQRQLHPRLASAI